MASKKKSAGLLFDEVLPQAQRTARSLLSLDPQEDVPASQQALEMALGFVPGVGQAMALRDIERARRANDPAAAAMAAASFVPFGRLAGLGKKAGPVMSELDVYHGSPHRFEEFDASKIGTGEGAQAYGHGIYLAESPAVGRQYAEFLASRKNDLLDPGNLAASMMYRTSEGTKKAGLREIDAALKGIKNYPNSYPDAPQQKAALEKARELLESGAELPKQGGNLYTADLPDEMVDRMLDWDKTMKNQPKAVKAALRSNDKLRKFLDKENSAMTGAEFHNWAQDAIDPPAGEWGIQRTSQELSRLLAEAGIPGIKYKDAGSRDRVGGTRNFVVFPGEEKKVKIKKRE